MKEEKFKFTREEFEKFLKVISELNKVSDTHKIKLNKDGILIYTLLGENQKINVLKTFYIKRNKLFSNLKESINLIFTLDFASNFEKKFKFLLDSEDKEFNCVFHYDEDSGIVYSFEMKNSFLHTICTAGHSSTIKDLTLETKKEVMNTDASEYHFQLPVKELDRIKKISKSEKDSDVITLNINNGSVYFGENSWNLKIKEDENDKNFNCVFKKSYMNSIIPIKDYVDFYIFPSYILVNEHKSQFLFSLELSS